MNLFAVQALFGGVKADGDVARSGPSGGRTGSADAAAVVEGAESDNAGFAALLQVAVEQQPPEGKLDAFGFAMTPKVESDAAGLVDGETRNNPAEGNTQPPRHQGEVVGLKVGGTDSGSLGETVQTQLRMPLPLAEGAQFPTQVPAEEPTTAQPPQLISTQAQSAPTQAMSSHHGRSFEQPRVELTRVEPSRVTAGALTGVQTPSPVTTGSDAPTEAPPTQLVYGEVVRSEPASNTGGPVDGDAQAVEMTPATDVPKRIDASITPAQSSRGPDPDRDLRRLDPRLRVAVGRVLRRLDQEFGIKAKVAEGFRTPERQKTLFAQGRTLPGKVVTWTLDSAHTKGRAVDLILNDQWTDLEPYRVLQTVAKQEGLHTLGMRDPGHLQLSESAKPMRIAEGERAPPRPTPEAEGASQGPREARPKSGLASTARVAGVAGRAFVARAAAPAVPGLGGLTQGKSLNIDASLLAPSRTATRRTTSTEGPRVSLRGDKPSVVTAVQTRPMLPQTPASIPEPRLEDPLPAPAPTDSRTALHSAEADVSEPRVAPPVASSERGVADLAPSGAEVRQATPSAAPDSPESTEVQREAPAVRTAESGSFNRGTPVRTLGAPGIAGRVEQVQALQEAAQARPPGMRVDLGDIDGEGTRVRLDLRGGRVDARIEVNDPALGNNLERRVDSLRAALESRGLEPETLQVRTVAEEPNVSTRLNSLDPSALLDGDPREPRGRSRENSDPSKDLREHRRQDEPKGKNENDSEDKRGQR